MVVLLVVMTAAVPRPAPRAEERFPLERPCRLIGQDDGWTGETVDVSLSGARVALHRSPEQLGFLVLLGPVIEPPNPPLGALSRSAMSGSIIVS